MWLDDWEIGVCDSVMGKMNDGLTKASQVVLCLSGSGSLSPRISRESMSALARQLSGAGVRLLPVRLTGGSLPAILDDIKYADLSADWPGGVEALCVALR